MKLAERSDSRGVSVRNINVNKKNPCVGKMNGLKYEEVLYVMRIFFNLFRF